MKKGEKYIIEIEEVHTHVDDNGKKFPLARIKGFSSLVFDQKGLDRLEMVKDVPKLNCRFVVTKDLTPFGCGLTEGKIYEVVDGTFLNDDNYLRPFCGVLIDENYLASYLKDYCEFCVIKE